MKDEMKKMIKIPTAYQDLLQDDTRAFVFLGTTMSDGSPQVTPVWFNEKDGYIYINSAKGRVKDHNLRERPQVALAIADPADPYRYLQIRGKVVERDRRRRRRPYSSALAKIPRQTI